MFSQIVKIRVLFWTWLIVLFIVNVIPLGDEVNSELSKGRTLLRYDYLLHSVTFLGFGWIYVLNRLIRQRIFVSYETLKILFIVAFAAVAFEGIQYALPYRAWNPADLVYNLIGVGLVGFIIFLDKIIWNRKCLKRI